MIGKLKDQIVQLSSGIHGLSRQLHPSILDDLGLVDAIRSECLHVSKGRAFQWSSPLEAFRMCFP